MDTPKIVYLLSKFGYHSSSKIEDIKVYYSHLMKQQWRHQHAKKEHSTNSSPKLVLIPTTVTPPQVAVALSQSFYYAIKRNYNVG